MVSAVDQTVHEVYHSHATNTSNVSSNPNSDFDKLLKLWCWTGICGGHMFQARKMKRGLLYLFMWNLALLVLLYSMFGNAIYQSQCEYLKETYYKLDRGRGGGGGGGGGGGRRFLPFAMGVERSISSFDTVQKNSTIGTLQSTEEICEAWLEEKDGLKGGEEGEEESVGGDGKRLLASRMKQTVLDDAYDRRRLADGAFEVISGKCKTIKNCFSSPNFPKNYTAGGYAGSGIERIGKTKTCIITVLDTNTYGDRLYAQNFTTESEYDFLYVGGSISKKQQPYLGIAMANQDPPLAWSGTTGPQDYQVRKDIRLNFYSDAEKTESGFQVCLRHSCTTGANGKSCGNNGSPSGTYSGDDKATCSCTCTNSYTGANCATPASTAQCVYTDGINRNSAACMCGTSLCDSEKNICFHNAACTGSGCDSAKEGMCESSPLLHCYEGLNEKQCICLYLKNTIATSTDFRVCTKDTGYYCKDGCQTEPSNPGGGSSSSSSGNNNNIPSADSGGTATPNSTSKTTNSTHGSGSESESDWLTHGCYGLLPPTPQYELVAYLIGLILLKWLYDLSILRSLIDTTTVSFASTVQIVPGEWSEPWACYLKNEAEANTAIDLLRKYGRAYSHSYREQRGLR